MTYERTRGVWAEACLFYAEMKDYCDQMCPSCHRERLERLLEYMGRHKQSLEHLLGHLEQGRADGAPARWFPRTPDGTVYPSQARVRIHAQMSVSEVVEAAMQMDEYLLELYKGLALSAADDGVKHMMEARLEHEQRTERVSVREAIDKT